MLRSDKIAERADAALKVEKLRAKMGMTWEELIVEEFDDHENEEDEDEEEEEEDEKDFDDVEQELDLDSLDHDQDEGN